jgi:hypothetical protein
MKGYRKRLLEFDAGAPVDRGEGKHHLMRVEQANADPDVGGDPVVIGTWRDDDRLVPAKPLA